MTRAELKTRAKAQLGNNIFGSNWMMALLVLVINEVIVGLASSILPGIGSILISGPMMFGVMYLFLKQVRDGQTMNVGDIFKGFTTDFGGTFLIGLMEGIFIFLWSLLLIIPGIVKTYAYSMAYYIKADHPEYGWKQCIDESQKLMDGHKMDLFVLDLSFIGWYIVGMLCLGIGTLWVAPYHEATRAQFYNSLVGNVITATAEPVAE